MKKFIYLSFLISLSLLNFSCGQPKEAADVDNAADDKIDGTFMQAGFYVSEDNQDIVRMGQDGSFKKIEVYKVGFGKPTDCKYDFEGAYVAYKRADKAREKIWKDATHVLRVKIDRITFTNVSELGFVQQQSCIEFQKAKLIERVLEVKYYATSIGPNQIRIFNSAQVSPSSTAALPPGMVYRRYN
ncbi:MAG: hypothetical protein AABY64_04325 [Bdellovibrionota bacterium]